MSRLIVTYTLPEVEVFMQLLIRLSVVLRICFLYVFEMIVLHATKGTVEPGGDWNEFVWPI